MSGRPDIGAGLDQITCGCRAVGSRVRDQQPFGLKVHGNAARVAGSGLPATGSKAERTPKHISVRRKLERGSLSGSRAKFFTRPDPSYNYFVE